MSSVYTLLIKYEYVTIYDLIIVILTNSWFYSSCCTIEHKFNESSKQVHF